MTRLLEEAELMSGGRPDLRQDGRIERGAIRDHFLRANTGLLEPARKAGNGVAIHRPIDQLIADQAIPRWRRRINRKQEGKRPLIDFIDAQNAREFLDHPGQIARLVLQVAAVGADHALGGPNPEIAGHAVGHAPEGQAIHKHGLDRLGHDTVRIDGITA